MRRSFKAATTAVALVLAFLAFCLAYSTLKGYTTWFAWIPQAVITADGKSIKGWLHGTRDHRALFFTRADSDRPFTYDLSFAPGGNGAILGCGSWVAPRVPLIPIGDVNPPCLSTAGGGGGHNLMRGQRSVSFVANDGVKLEAHW
jgi:hypothetical protein